MEFKNPEDTTEDLVESVREIKRAAFHLLKLSWGTRIRLYRSGLYSEPDPIAKLIDSIIWRSGESEMEARELIRRIEEAENIGKE